MYGVVLIAIIAVMGGAIAYIGDKLGTKVGKKKLSIFGLRPKHTSIIVTIVTGILISALTLMFMTAVSWDVRTALFGMEELKAELVSLTTEVDSKSSELDRSRAELETKTAEYVAITAKVRENAERLAQSMAELDAVTAERDKTAAALSQLQSNYALAQKNLVKYQGDIQKLQATKTELDDRIAGLNTKMSELTTAQTALQSDVDRLNELTVSLKNGLQSVREGTVVFRTGEVLSTAVIDGGKPLAETTAALGVAVYRANLQILDTLDIAEQKLEVLWIARSEFDQAAALIAGTNQPVIVRISTVGNTVYGEPVIGRIELYPNHLVYNKGGVVYSEVVNAPANAQQAEEAVMLFLQKVNAAAVTQGILPDPIQGTVGSMSGSQLFEVVNRAKRYNGKIELTAEAKADTYTVGPLQIEIRIKSAF
ncbi:DUF3084 domain-containing protein [Sporomusa termitida]|uniref:Chromosome partition protein Smc n=1 Tax=Sporomusa termitida TaxID=2377 RepID=A0A517DXG4_9FIRM|nr:DUF3084 domain-containing protein [Sporomusa termitida]QDR82055.1 Chromosome partition protein Smc [Sporomusa termitida]